MAQNRAVSCCAGFLAFKGGDFLSSVIEPGMPVWIKAKSITALEMRGRRRSDLIQGTVQYVGKRCASVVIPLEYGTIRESFSFDELIFENSPDKPEDQSTEAPATLRRPTKKGVAAS